MAKGDLIRQYLSEEDLRLIGEFINQAETATSGEIRVVVREKRDWFTRLFRYPVRRLALEEFHRLQMHRTRDRTGVIFFFLLEDRHFYIYGDRGIHQCIGQETWDTLTAEVGAIARQQNLGTAIRHGLQRMGNLLAAHFPVKPDDVNELSNEVEIR